jgi:hypothetical protein
MESFYTSLFDIIWGFTHLGIYVSRCTIDNSSILNGVKLESAFSKSSHVGKKNTYPMGEIGSS